MINIDPVADGRSAGSLTWAGLFNTYYWIDPAMRIAGVIMMQILPFADRQALAGLSAIRARDLPRVQAGLKLAARRTCDRQMRVKAGRSRSKA